MNRPIRLGILGLGRIGRMHIQNILTMKEYEIAAGVDPFLTKESAQELLALGLGRCGKDPQEIFGDPTIDAVVICSITETHSDFIIRAARAGMDIFCEKPIDHDVSRILAALRAVREANVILQVGFMHRFDRHHRAVKRAIANGDIGRPEVLKIVSRDPAPPGMKYIRESGGIFVDFMIHDFDMARFLMDCEVTEVFATGTSVCDPEIAKAGDFGSGHAILRFENGAIGVLETSRRCTFGHDQRIEALGSKGCVMDDNEYENNVRLFGEAGYTGARVPWHFPERYKDAYLVELADFANAVRNRTASPVGGFDGLQAVLIAEAANRSVKTGRFEAVETITV